MDRKVCVLGVVMAGCISLGGMALGEAGGINIGINVGVPVSPPYPPPVAVEAPPPIVVDVRPRLVLVPGGAVSYAPDLPYNYFVHAGTYYVFHGSRWYRAPAYHGPWTGIAVDRVPVPVRRVPLAYYRIPPGHRKHDGPPPWAGHGHGHGHKHGKHKHNGYDD